MWAIGIQVLKNNSYITNNNIKQTKEIYFCRFNLYALFLGGGYVKMLDIVGQVETHIINQNNRNLFSFLILIYYSTKSAIKNTQKNYNIQTHIFLVKLDVYSLKPSLLFLFK